MSVAFSFVFVARTFLPAKSEGEGKVGGQECPPYTCSTHRQGYPSGTLASPLLTGFCRMSSIFCLALFAANHMIKRFFLQ